MAIVAAIACVTAYAADKTIPIGTVLENLQPVIHMDMQQNIFAFATGSKIHVYDLDTGKRRWWKPCTYEGKHYYHTDFGKDYVVMISGDHFIALDKATGNELWQKEMGDLKNIEHAYFYDETNWLKMECEGGRILYDMDAQKGYRMPFGDNFKGGMMPDGKTLYEIRKGGNATPQTYDVLFWKPGDQQPEKRCSLESSGKLIVRGVTEDAFLISDIDEKRTPEHILRTYDASTGEILHEFNADITASFSLTKYRILSREAGYFFWLDEEKQRHLHKLDIATGDTCAMALPEEFTVLYYSITTDTEGNWWLLAWDEDYNLFLLPFNHDAVPRKLLDGHRFLLSRYSLLDPPYLFTRHAYKIGIHTSVYRLDNMHKLTEWQGFSQPIEISNNAQYWALQNLEEQESAYMYSSEKEKPLLKVKGSPLAVSSDGRYLVVRENTSSHNSPRVGAIHVIDVTIKEPVLRFDIASSEDKAAFSDDSLYLAFFHSGILKLLDIEAGFAEKILLAPDRRVFNANSISFSPDNRRLLMSEPGQAVVFDVATGRHINTFKETAKIVPEYEHRSRNPGFLQSIEYTVRDFAGQYTNQLAEKKTPRVTAQFAKNGAQVVTVSERKLIRVWDTETGRLIRTIDPELPTKRDEEGSIGSAIELSGNGKYALSYNWRGLDQGTLWDLEKGVKVRSYTFQDASKVFVALSEDGTRVYALIDDDLHFLAGATNR